METNLVALTVIGGDQPGIVAAVTRALYELGGNLQDATSTILRGHFSMMLIVSLPQGTNAGAVERALAGPATDLDLVVAARPVDALAPQVTTPTHIVSVYGADRPGIVFRVAGALAARGANITDLRSRVVGPPDASVYSVILEAEVPEGADLDRDMSELARDLGVEISVNTAEADLL